MEIPYTVRPREDTGLFNAKVGIWLFLASEVMLFGALFSTYILLRVSAAPGTWPHGLLNVPLGTINTLVLIVSSVTVVMAWASLKMNKFYNFKRYEALTVACAATFLVIKSFEYKDKFTHYEIHLKSGEIVDGHLAERTKDSITVHIPKARRQSALARETEKQLTAHGEPSQVKAEAHPAPTEGAAAEGHHERVIPIADIALRPSGKLWMENYGPWHSTYMAIYFTLTGLHALHVFGGALVIGFFWLPGSKMWKTEPERFTNRIEVSGLFWHFVDLVWIFLFPVLYLL
jgi:cytochrome c oxidase subunit 3